MMLRKSEDYRFEKESIARAEELEGRAYRYGIKSPDADRLMSRAARIRKSADLGEAVLATLMIITKLLSVRRLYQAVNDIGGLAYMLR